MKAEDRFVERLRAQLPEDERVAVGPGDDAAVVRVEKGELVATTDQIVEGVDFPAGTSGETIGRRALAVNLSDLAAMGARPEFFLLSLAFPGERGEEFPDAVVRGALSRARPLDVSLVGGDLSSATATVVGVALWGRAVGRPLLRSGGRAGDLLFLTGFPGRAAAGLGLALRRTEGRGRGALGGLSPEHERELLDAYLDPEPRLALGLELSRENLATASIDVSDGVGVDASRLARASGVRAVIEEDRLPISPSLAACGALEERDPLDWILAGGDDYELLFSAPGSALRQVEALATREVPVTRVGLLEPGEGAVLRRRSGDSDIASRGHDHFERSA